MDKQGNIFKPSGSVNWSTLATPEKDKFQAYITITVADNDTKLLCRAPITGVRISQLTDFSVTKSLDRDFLVATFGDTPTRIQLDGLTFFNLNGCPMNNTKGDKQQIMTFYKKNKVSTDISKRLDISIASGVGEPAVSFRTVLVGLDTVNKSDESGMSNVMATYTMTLIGVER